MISSVEGVQLLVETLAREAGGVVGVVARVPGGTGETATRLILLQSLSNLPDPSAYIFSTIKPVRGICTLFVKITFDCYVFVPLYPPVGSKYCMYLDCWRRRVFHTAFSPVMDGFYFFYFARP